MLALSLLIYQSISIIPEQLVEELRIITHRKTDLLQNIVFHFFLRQKFSFQVY